MTVRCPFSGDHVEIECSPADDIGDAWTCPDCEGDITLESGMRFKHAAGEWITCPVSSEDVFVWTEEDEDYQCDECPMTIEVRGGVVEHEPVELVECPAFEGETSLVPLAQDEDYECDHCSATINVSDGEARHEDVQEVACERYPDQHVVVPLEEEAEFECPFCGVDIVLDGGEAVHLPATGGGGGGERSRDGKWEIFISAKRTEKDGSISRDSDIADELYDRLNADGWRVFFSPRSLEEMGIADYKAEIDRALEDVAVLIVVGTSRANLESRWVKYEWDSFLTDYLSDVKPIGCIFSVLDGVDLKDLPRPLRQWQAFRHTPAAMDQLSRFVGRTLRRKATKQSLDA